MVIGVYADMGTYQTPTGGTREQLGGGNFYFQHICAYFSMNWDLLTSYLKNDICDFAPILPIQAGSQKLSRIIPLAITMPVVMAFEEKIRR